VTPTIIETLEPLYRRGPSPTRYPVSVDDFIPAMAAHWTRLGNVVSPELQFIWTRICTTLNQQVLQHGTVEGDRWRVIPAELGVGKTESVKLWCSLLPKATHDPFNEPHPGVLIITRLKKQADEIAADICRHASDDGAAAAFHTDSRLALDALSKCPVLAITHSAYERGLEAITREKVENLAKWKHLHAWGLNGRQLVLVDESLDLIREERASLNNLRHLRAVIPDDMMLRHRNAVKALDAIITALSAFAEKKLKERRADPIEINTLPPEVSFEPLWSDLKSNDRWPSSLIFGDPDVPGSVAKTKATFFRRLRLTLSGAQALLDRWRWYFYKLGDHTLSTSLFLLPDEGIRGAVILDATAERNHLYKLFGERFEIVTVPSARRYGNVRHRFVYADWTGKAKVIEHADEIVKEMIENLKAHYGSENTPHRSVLFISHKDVKSSVMKWAKDAGFKEVAFAHWNALDGLNEWSHFNTVVVLSQPYRDPATPANIFQAVYGPQSTAWLNNSKLRKWGDFEDILDALETSHLVVSNAQGINRARCRRVIDAQGNCKQTDVFSRIPKRRGKVIIDGLELAMPNIKQTEWISYKSDRKSTLTPSFDEALVAHAEHLNLGYTKAATVRTVLAVSPRHWDRLVTDMKNPESGLALRLAAHGVSYVVERTGRTQTAYLHKTTAAEGEDDARSRCASTEEKETNE
jgi:hypothetical protein